MDSTSISGKFVSRMHLSLSSDSSFRRQMRIERQPRAPSNTVLIEVIGWGHLIILSMLLKLFQGKITTCQILLNNIDSRFLLSRMRSQSVTFIGAERLNNRHTMNGSQYKNTTLTHKLQPSSQEPTSLSMINSSGSQLPPAQLGRSQITNISNNQRS